MKVLVINAGSSSLKYQFIDMDNECLIAKGLCERIGTSGVITHSANDKKITKEVAMPTHKEAFDAVIAALTEGEGKVINSMSEISAVGHRVVQGGMVYNKSCLITEDVLNTVEELKYLAPLHNPANILGIKACQAVLGDTVPQVAVFDTAFHQTMPALAYTYAIPYEYYEKYGIRRYGFHGTSHRFVSERCAAMMGKDAKGLKIITCHLGNGCSITAVKDGESIDTSMGFTPLDGFMMGTRCGSLDPSIVTFIAERENLTPSELDSLFNKKSGLLGVSGISNDSRDVEAAANGGNERAALAYEMQEYQIAKYIGSYAAAMGGVDAIVFTGGIGENNAKVRKYVCDKVAFMGFTLDEDKNSIRGEEIEISTDDSKVKVFVIPTNEELVIARDTVALVQ